MDCDCKDYKEGMKQIIDAQRFLAVTRNVEYTGKKIKFCPWCGRHLTSAMHSDGDTARQDCEREIYKQCDEEDIAEMNRR